MSTIKAAPATKRSSSAPAPAGLDRYRVLGRSGLRVSPLCLGAMTFGEDWGWGADADTSRAIFDRYVEAGGNFIDTANLYTNGTSERIVGECIASDRSRFVVATKYTMNARPGDPNAGGNHRKNMMQSVEASLDRLRTDYIDLYWIHAWDWTTPVDEVMRAFDDLVRSGKVFHVGISDAPAWIVSQANTIAALRGWTGFVGLQVNYSLAVRDVERDLAPMAVAFDIGITPWSPLASGVLSGKYTRKDIEVQRRRQSEPGYDPFTSAHRSVNLTEKRLVIADMVREVAGELGRTPSQVAIAWLLTRPGVTSPIIGARNVKQLEDNIGALEVAFTADQLARLDEVSAIDLGFPHDFLASSFVRSLIHGTRSGGSPPPT